MTKDQPVLVLEAMKMEHALRAPRGAKIDMMSCAVGDQVSDGALLVQLGDTDE